ncbi:hypothetical protein FGO68_gene14762 [Halteria grandinella]|uniref:Uncharacterized protein n=1 Tax=Halteria grandinella TaxID=5974 RepID=A0A8J8SX15_HALGN|nr:hypothetical protein FGO68_gene14762 [Halteria grandinella]
MNVRLNATSTPATKYSIIQKPDNNYIFSNLNFNFLQIFSGIIGGHLMFANVMLSKTSLVFKFCMTNLTFTWARFFAFFDLFCVLGNSLRSFVFNQTKWLLLNSTQ